jgi:hypothetical protein
MSAPRTRVMKHDVNCLVFSCRRTYILYHIEVILVRHDDICNMFIETATLGGNVTSYRVIT